MEPFLKSIKLDLADQAINLMRTNVADMSNRAAVDIKILIALQGSRDALATDSDAIQQHGS